MTKPLIQQRTPEWLGDTLVRPVATAVRRRVPRNVLDRELVIESLTEEIVEQCVDVIDDRINEAKWQMKAEWQVKS